MRPLKAPRTRYHYTISFGAVRESRLLASLIARFGDFLLAKFSRCGVAVALTTFDPIHRKTFPLSGKAPYVTKIESNASLLSKFANGQGEQWPVRRKDLARWSFFGFSLFFFFFLRELGSLRVYDEFCYLEILLFEEFRY